MRRLTFDQVSTLNSCPLLGTFRRMERSRRQKKKDKCNFRPAQAALELCRGEKTRTSSIIYLEMIYICIYDYLMTLMSFTLLFLDPAKSLIIP